MKRYALIQSSADAIRSYLPANYQVLMVEEPAPSERHGVTVIGGEDVAGWTLHEYVLPRLASGIFIGEEIDLSHPVMKRVPA